MRAAVHRRLRGSGTDRAGAAAAGGRDGVLIRVHASTVSADGHRAGHRGVPHGPWQVAGFGIGTFRPRRRRWAWTSPSTGRTSRPRTGCALMATRGAGHEAAPSSSRSLGPFWRDRLTTILTASAPDSAWFAVAP
jgi:hypothetical protein